MQNRRDAISEVIRRWRDGEQANAQAVLLAHPELAAQKSLVLDLAYEEYCLRSAAGEAMNVSTFCDRFPTYRHSLQRLLCVHDYLANDEAFAALAGTIPWPELGEKFLGFIIQEELGRGAMARVFLATQPALGDRFVALKLSAGSSTEAAILGKLTHPNIVPIFSVQEDLASGLTAICMEFRGSATLCDILDYAFISGRPPIRAAVVREAARDGRIAVRPREGHWARFRQPGNYVDWVVEIGVQLAKALAFAHSKGVLHRDLKPSNVLITPSGEPLLLDFNLSFDPQVSELRFGGTLPYSAPEQLRSIFPQWRNGDEPVDQRSDIYSLGVILYQMLTGSLPFGDGTDAESASLSAGSILARQAAGAPSVEERVPTAGRALNAVISRCLEFDPAKRPRTADELAKVLRGCLSLRNRTVRWSKRNRLASAMIIATSASLLLAAALFFMTRDPYPIREFNAGVRDFRANEIKAAILHFDRALTARPDDVKSLLARAQAWQQQGDFRLATIDYDAAGKLSSAGIIRACLGYCLAELKEMRPSIERSQQAIAAGCATAEVYNNLGAGFLQLGRLPEAAENLDKAIELNDSLQAAHYNRARVELQRVANKRESPERGIAEFERALKLGPASAEVYFNLARIHAAAANGDHRQAVIRNLIAAADEGLAVETIKSDPSVTEYLKDPELKGLRGGPPKARRHPSPQLFIAPPCQSLDCLPAND